MPVDMDYGRLGERRRNFQFPILEILSALMLLMAIVLSMFELVTYSNQKDDLPTDLTVAGVAVGGLSESDAQARWERVYIEQPVQLVYDGNPIDLYPSEIGFRVNSEAMLAEARQQTTQERSFWIGFWNFLESRAVAAVTIPLDAEYEVSDLRDYLERLAVRYDEPSGEAGVDLTSLTFTSGTFGRELDIDSAIAMIDQALRSPDAPGRYVILPTLSTSSSGQSMNTLRDAILALMQNHGFDYDGPDTVAAVYIMNLATGEEVHIQSDVPFGAVSTIKIPIMINLFRHELLVPNGSEIAYLLTESLLCSNNASSNLLMQVVGDALGAAEQQLRDGLNQVSCTAQSLGAQYTYISAPLYVADRTYEFEAVVCRPDAPSPSANIYTEPDAYSQTTAADMGLLLTQIYDCAQYGSGLHAIYPEDITQHECQQMINLLSGNRIGRLFELGIPEGIQIAHKNGWGPPGISADAAIIFTPGGNYVITMYTYERDFDLNGLPTLQAWELIEEVSRLTYNYFNPGQPLLQRREPLNAYGAINCVTVASPDLVNLDDIDANRIDANGDPVPGACYGGAGNCQPFDGWGQ
ncbi:MAG: serine hydrolase [Anaerolineae bacterium]|nr:serine hydrolase [Anaerolineae bacterium]